MVPLISSLKMSIFEGKNELDNKVMPYANGNRAKYNAAVDGSKQYTPFSR